MTFKLLVLDIDNTVFDWVTYYTSSFSRLLETVANIISSRPEILAKESSEIFAAHGSVEYPFVVQEMPSVNAYYGHDIDRMLNECVTKGREAFNAEAQAHLKPYKDVPATLAHIRRDYPTLPLIALTDAPRYVAMWKLNKLGLLNQFTAVYGLADPRLPTDSVVGRVKVDPEILLKHLQQHNFGFKGRIRILPDDYEKPGTRGLKTVLMDHEMDEPASARRDTLWIGDNLTKDVALGHRLGVSVGWASYGTKFNPDLLKVLHQFSSPQSIKKNVHLKESPAEAQKPEFTLQTFSDLETILKKSRN